MRTLLACLIAGMVLTALPFPASAGEARPRTTLDFEVGLSSNKPPVRRMSLSDPAIPTPPATGAEIPLLVRDLASADDDTRNLAAVRLFHTGDPAVAALGKVLRAEHPHQRRYAALVLVALGTKKALAPLRAVPMPWLFEDLRSDDDKAALQAAVVMAQIGGAREVAAVCAVLDDADAAMELRSFILFGFALGRSPKCVPAVERCLHDENPFIRHTAITTYALLRGEQATDKLLTLLPDPNPLVRFGLIGILAGKKDPRARDALVTILLHEGASWSRAFAAVTLQDHAQHPNVLPYLQRAERDPSRLVQVVAAMVLGKDISEQDFIAAIEALVHECGGTEASFVIETLKGKIEGTIEQRK
ncbi:MAG TPA: HEAT repeat domain-containing protein [Armatimonadota bacterium]|nr:HEAT repeat domain-containing protein [Armatimonadota bacterium]HOS43936.1 HEAT repeat domain-containing protein [Armatimonadota bacterium]